MCYCTKGKPSNASCTRYLIKLIQTRWECCTDVESTRKKIRLGNVGRLKLAPLFDTFKCKTWKLSSKQTNPNSRNVFALSCVRFVFRKFLVLPLFDYTYMWVRVLRERKVNNYLLEPM